MIQRGGEVVIRMLENVKQPSIFPLIQSTIAPGTLVYTDEYDIYHRLPAWGYGHKTVCHSRGEYARDEDGDGFHEVHVNTMEGFWVFIAILATASSWYFSGIVARLSRVLRVRA